MSFERIGRALYGSKVWVVVETKELKDKTVNIEILGSKTTTFIAPDEVMSVISEGNEVTKILATGGAYAKKTEYTNAAQFADFAIAELQLKPKDKTKAKDWGKKLHDSTDKKGWLHLQITAEGGTDTEYQNEDATITEPTKDKSIFLNKDKAYFELGPCFCDRDFSVDEFRDIIKSLRDAEEIRTTSLFYDDNCPIPNADKTHERFVAELNAMLKKYTINTCLRKLHFLAQSYHESGRYGTTLEGASGTRYNPGGHPEAAAHGHTVAGDGPRYKGRGLIQITWRDQQKKYLRYASTSRPEILGGLTIDQLFDRSTRYTEKYVYTKSTVDKNGKKKKEKVVETVDVDGAALIANNLNLAMDSAGWYWRNLGNITATNEDINTVADTDNILRVSQCINGRVSAANLYGLTERTTFRDLLKNILNYDDCINKA